ncbi:MAG: caspase family protein, partial [Pseudomonadota bacterium]
MRPLVLVFVATLFGLSTAAAEERRLALVLANQDYPAEIGRLTNTHQDAAKVEAALRDTGFAVTKVLDADASGLETAITQFEIAIDQEAADGDDVVAF